MRNEPIFDLPILLVDDDALVRDVVTEYLKDMGFHNITVLSDARQAQKILQGSQQQIKLVLSDWEMPQVTGLSLLKTVRNHPLRQKTKFIMITSQRSMERFKISQAAKFSVDAYVIKPFRIGLLKQKIWSVMGWEDEKQVG